MANYDNIARSGTRSSTSIANPRKIEEDLSKRVSELAAEQIPMIELIPLFDRGPVPISFKVETELYDKFDHIDNVAATAVSATVGWKRFANITPVQQSRQTTNGNMFYHVQDKLHILDTGQTVEVVMTETEQLKVSHQTGVLIGQVGTGLPTDLTGSTATAAAKGTMVVRNVEQEDLIPIPVGATIIFLDRTIYESQDIEAIGSQFDTYFGCNFVETKEAVVTCTEDWYEWVETKGKGRDFDFQQRETIEKFKKSINYSMLYGAGSNDMTADRAKRHMRGIIPSIRTNVLSYNPQTVTDFEIMVRTWMRKQVFRYNNGANSKIAMPGMEWLDRFERSFAPLRRTDLSNTSITPAGLTMSGYRILNYMLKFKMGAFDDRTAASNWCLVIDPMQIEYRPVKEWRTRWYSNPNQRDKKFMIEWKGTMSFHHEQYHSLMRTPMA